MQISRRGFLGGLVASATMAEAGAISEMLAWLRRKPVSIAPPAKGWPNHGIDLSSGRDSTRMFFSRDGGISWREIPGVRNVQVTTTGFYYDDITHLTGAPPLPALSSTEIEVKGSGMPLMPDLLECGKFRLVTPSGLELRGEIGFSELNQDVDRVPRFSLKGYVMEPEIYEFRPPRRLLGDGHTEHHQAAGIFQGPSQCRSF